MFKQTIPLLTLAAFWVMLTGCTAPALSPASTATPIPSFTTTPESPSTTTPSHATSTSAPPSLVCKLPTVVAPTLPAMIPAYTELDQTTGLHMTGSYQVINLQSYRLEVSGKVAHSLNLSFDELRCLPHIEVRCNLVCPGFFVDTATWAGASLDALLDLAGVQSDATDIKMYSADGYSAALLLKDARDGENFLAYEWEGQPIPILHGFPVRAVFPDQEGNKWVKWLVRITVD